MAGYHEAPPDAEDVPLVRLDLQTFSSTSLDELVVGRRVLALELWSSGARKYGSSFDEEDADRVKNFLDAHPVQTFNNVVVWARDPTAVVRWRVTMRQTPRRLRCGICPSTTVQSNV